MAEVTFNVAPATPRKRSHEDEGFVSNPDRSNLSLSDQFATSMNHSDARHASPAPSTASSLTDLTSINDQPSSATKPSSTGTPAHPSKKRKLGFIEAQAEKAAKQREKEEKTRLKTEEKSRKDEEKRRVAEDRENAKRVRELEKAEKQKVKDEEKAVKDAEKAQKEAEKREKDAQKEAAKAQKDAEQLRKERSQMRLGAFFGKPKPEETPPTTPEDVSEGASSRRSSIASVDMEKPVLELRSNKPSNIDFARFMLPFFVLEHTDIAPANRFKLSRHADFEVTQNPHTTISNLQDHFGRPRKRTKKTISIKQVFRHVQESGLDINDVDIDTLNSINTTPYKHLQFHENSRPPYQGTYTRPVSPRTACQVSRNPFARRLPDTNYDYDSEAEWEPPDEDDEDLGDEDEMSDADEGEEEMADFLDDAEDIARKKGPMADMEPISSGLCWVGEHFNDKGPNLEQYRMEFLHDSTTFPIDPYSTKHWLDDTKQKLPTRQEVTGSTMQPPRQPLSALSPNAAPTIKLDVGIDGKPLPVQSQKANGNNKPLKLIDAEFMDDFKRAVDGNELTKAGLIEVLKKQFRQCSKDAIKDTLGTIAVRVGKKESEKKWQLVGQAQS